MNVTTAEFRSRVNVAVLVEQQIIELIRLERMPMGTRLPERLLAERLRVSRTPVKDALRSLEMRGFVERGEHGGYVVGAPTQAGDAEPHTPDLTRLDDDICLTIAEDRLAGSIPDRVSENELMRRYGLSKGHLRAILARIVGEGWLEKLPGHGWSFARSLTSSDALQQISRFRQAVEPAAILDPNFELNRPALEAARRNQTGLLDGSLVVQSPAQLFDIHNSVHQSIVRCSRNLYFIESMKNTDNIRRLLVYRKLRHSVSDKEPCRQHIQLIDLILADKRAEASEFLRWHLECAQKLSAL